MITCISIQSDAVVFHCDQKKVNFSGRLDITQASQDSKECHRIIVTKPEGLEFTSDELSRAYLVRLNAQLEISVTIMGTFPQQAIVPNDAMKAFNAYTAGRDCSDC